MKKTALFKLSVENEQLATSSFQRRLESSLCVNGPSAYVPDLPGCIATGVTLEQVEQEIREAIAFHIDGMREDGIPIPEPSSMIEYIECAA